MALIDRVKWDEPGDLFAWKFQNEDGVSDELSTATQLIVNESQEALLFKEGKRMDTFGAGRHTLSTKNIPILNKLINLPFGGETPFTAEVWFVNKAIPLDIKWGTSTPIQLEDPEYQIIIPVRAFGQFGLQISDSGKFVTKLVGATSSFNTATIQSYFKGILLSQLKAAVATAMIKKEVGILDITAELVNLSEQVQADLAPEYEEYGISIKAFRIISINVPEDDESYVMLKQAKANAVRRRIEGFTYEQQRSFDVMETAAGNEGGMAGTMVGAGVGLGMGLGVGQQVGNMVGNTMNTGGGSAPGAPPAAGSGPPPPPAGNAPANPFGQSAGSAQFHIFMNNQQMGPYGMDILQQGVTTGQFTTQTQVWRQGMPGWIAAGQVPELASLFPAAAPPSAPSPFGQAPAPPATPPAAPTPPAPEPSDEG
jgi:membrane protease subunit (stomatin/prohibitin family)